MKMPYVIVSSITYAYKGKEALERRGYSAFIERAPASISGCQCDFIIKFRGCSVDRAMEILRTDHVKIIGAGGTAL